MSDLDSLKRKIRQLENESEELLQLGITILQEALPESEETSNSGYLKDFDYRNPIIETQRKALRKYQEWYSTSLHLVTEYTPEWLDDFKTYYYSPSSHPQRPTDGVLTYFRLQKHFNFRTREYVVGSFIRLFDNQISILSSIPSILEVKEMKLRKLISATFINTEIEEAEVLLSANHCRAAGAVAGVALELYLKTLCDIHKIDYSPKATIEPILQILYKEGKLDVTEMKRMQYLASIRNKCSHPDNVSEAEVSKLIEAVKELPNSMR